MRKGCMMKEAEAGVMLFLKNIFIFNLLMIGSQSWIDSSYASHELT